MGSISSYLGVGTQKLKFEIADVSSEDPANLAEAMNPEFSFGNFGSGTGWSSRKFCDYPQHVTL